MITKKSRLYRVNSIKRRRRRRRMSSSSSSSDSSVGGFNTKHYQIKSSKTFSTWKTKTLAVAKASGLKKYLVANQTVLSDDEFDALVVNYINADRSTRDGKLIAREYESEKKKKDSWAKAEKLMVNSIVSSSMMKRLGLCESPKEMFECICKKYGRESNTDLDGLIKEIQSMKLRSMKTDPEDYFTEIDDLNDCIEKIDPNQVKNPRAICLIIMNGLHRKYRTVKTSIELNNEEDDLDQIKTKVH